ncbi:relaxase/mobilization nuclease domain-containing protein [uncultured Fusobacterium sp.]|uniref:relaxase/mobilization nuclease domain-containing protein n=1 Tax=uncultured Fusobacterium sp. TaxID=159267 RepID=UPI0025F2B256|nr:relaxase/mobilization nuclease domain-containing protein [uncultured Fusobacterium sp.]
MAIIKVVKKSGKTYTSLKKVLNYVGEKAYKTYGINCNEDYKRVAYDFFETKDYFNKKDGRQYRHYIQSFSPKEVSKDKALEIAIKWAEEAFPGHEVFIAVHDDKEHFHSHFIVNTVNFETGEKLHEGARNLAFKKELNDKICKSHGIDNQKLIRQKGDVVSYDKNKYQIIKKGADITKLAENIIKNMQISISKENFIFNMQKDGYSTEWEENKKHIVFTVDKNILKGKKEKFRLSNLEKTFNIDDFRKEKLLEIFKLNQEKERKSILDKITTNMELKKEVSETTSLEKEKVKVSSYSKNKNGYGLEF